MKLQNHLKVLVAQYEGNWTAGTALPSDLFEKLRRAIVGFEMPIARLEGKWKLGQNRTRADRLGVIEALRASASANDNTLADWTAAALDMSSSTT